MNAWISSSEVSGTLFWIKSYKRQDTSFLPIYIYHHDTAFCLPLNHLYRSSLLKTGISYTGMCWRGRFCKKSMARPQVLRLKYTLYSNVFQSWETPHLLRLVKELINQKYFLTFHYQNKHLNGGLSLELSKLKQLTWAITHANSFILFSLVK